MKFEDLFMINSEKPKTRGLSLDDIKYYERLVCGVNFQFRGTILSDLEEVAKEDRDLVYRFLRAPVYEYDALVAEGRMAKFPNKRVFNVSLCAANSIICSIFLLANAKGEMETFDIVGITYMTNEAEFIRRGYTMDYHSMRDESYFKPRYIGLIYLLMLKHSVVKGSFLPAIIEALGSNSRLYKPDPRKRYNYSI